MKSIMPLIMSFIDVNSVVNMLKHKPERLHVILTGRYAKPEIIDIADTVTEMKVVKHARL